MKTVTDISYGVIPTRHTETGLEVFLIYQFSAARNDVYWTFPKGHPENGEAPEEAAVREFREETGLEIQELFPEPLFQQQYTYDLGDVLVEKTAAFFLATVLPGEATLQDAEVRDAGWFPVAEVLDRLDFQTTKDMWQEVLKFI